MKKETEFKKHEIQLVPVGTNKKQFVLSLSKKALTNLKEGKSYPIILGEGDKQIKLYLMRDRVFHAKVKAFNQLPKEKIEEMEKQAEKEDSKQKE